MKSPPGSAWDEPLLRPVFGMPTTLVDRPGGKDSTDACASSSSCVLPCRDFRWAKALAAIGLLAAAFVSGYKIRDSELTRALHSPPLGEARALCGETASFLQIPAVRQPSSQAKPVPEAKALVLAMDDLIGRQYKWNDYDAWSRTMLQFFSASFTYDLSYPLTGVYRGIREWFDGEHIPWNVALPHAKFEARVGFIFAGHKNMVTLTTWAQANFVSAFKGIPHTPTGAKAREIAEAGGDPEKALTVGTVDLDFYLVGPDPAAKGELRILYNWCMMDLYALMVQTGRRVGIPPAPLPEGRWYPPRAMQGLPAPASEYVDPGVTNSSNAVILERVLQLLAAGATGVRKYGALIHDGKPCCANPIPLSELLSKDAVMYGNPWGIGMATGREAIVNSIILRVLVAPFGGNDRRVRFDQVFCEGTFCGAHGYITGQVDDGTIFLGHRIQEGGQELSLRFGAHFLLDDQSRIRDAWCLLDIPSAMQSVGIDLIAAAQLQH